MKNKTPTVGKIAGIFPTVSEDALKRLAADIQRNGLIEPIWVQQGEIVDGRHRLEACRIAGVRPEFREIPYGVNAIDFAISLNANRRDLTKSQRAASAVLAMALDNGDIGFKSLSGRQDARYGERFGVSARYVASAKKLKLSHPDAFDAVFTGQLALSAAWRQTRYAIRKIVVPNQSSEIHVERGDAFKLFRSIKPSSLDLIVTDPLYFESNLGDWPRLASKANHVLKSSGFLVAMFGQNHAMSVLSFLNQELHYHWLGSIVFDSVKTSRQDKHVHTGARLFAVFSKQRRAVPTSWLSEPILVRAADREHAEPLQKNYWLPPSVFASLIKAFSPIGGWVCDPFMGEGSCGLAAATTGRNFAGMEHKADVFQAAKDHLQGAGLKLRSITELGFPPTPQLDFDHLEPCSSVFNQAPTGELRA